jgi:putative ABC transport system substrate-binding protein
MPPYPGSRRLARALARWRVRLALVLGFGLASTAGAVDLAPAAIAVLVPEVAEPYRSVFAKIVEGTESATHAGVTTIAVGANVDTAQLGARLRGAGTKVVIALGRHGLKATEGLDSRLAVVVGGVMLLADTGRADTLSGISLSPDPALLFARLKVLQPAVRRVLVVYDPKHNDWLIRLARDAAAAQSLELVAYEAPDLAAAAKAYELLFANAAERRDAVWLPQDPTTVEESTLVPLVLKESWNRHLAVFSSSYVHVRKGALFVLYPDNFELGRDLGTTALKLLAGEPRAGMRPLREVLTGVNLRSASHLGLKLDPEQLRGFDSVFQEQ